MADLRAQVEHLKVSKRRKSSGYDPKLSKLFTKANRAKPLKYKIDLREREGALKFKSTGKKPSPLNEIEISKIKDLKKSSPQKRTLAFAYPGPDQRHPILLCALRFAKENDYNKFIDLIESPSPMDYRGSDAYVPSVDRGPDTGIHEREEHHEKSKKSSTSSRSSSSSSSSSSMSSERKSRSHSKSQSYRGNAGVLSYISTDCVFEPYRKRSKGPVFTVKSPFRVSYISTKSKIRETPSPLRRPHSTGPRSNVRVQKIYRVERSPSYGSSYSSSSSYDSLTSISSRDYNSRHRRPMCRSYSSSSSSSSAYTTDSGPDFPNGRSFVISRCSQGRKSGVRCRPVGEFIVTKETPSFSYEA